MRNKLNFMNRIKVMTLILLTLLIANYAKATVAFAGGSGTQEEPYKITNAEQLSAIRDGLDKHYKLENDVTLTTWTPIGLSDNTVANFTGSFDGAGHLISGLAIADGARAGLFASNAGTIKNLGVVVAEAGVTGVYAGGIAGENTNTGTITNCYTTGAFVSTKNAFSYAGGIVGQNNGQISSCYTTLDEIRCVGTSSYNYYVGGIAGETTSTASIQHCLVLCKKIDWSNGKGSIKMDRIAGARNDLSGTADNNTNFYGYDLAVTLPNYWPNQPYGIPGLLWNGSFAEGNTSWAFDEAEENFYLKTTDGNEMGGKFAVATYRYLQGEGTAEVPYEISTADDFKRMSVRTNQNYSQEIGKHYKLMQAVTISEEFLQISATRSFKGIFDGNGQTITMTKLPGKTDTYRRYGLFGLIGGNCVIKNLHIDCNIDMDVSNETGDNNLYLGTLYSSDDAFESPIIVENCYITGSLTVKCPKDFGIGGLAGTCSGATIKNCFTDVDIKVSTTLPVNSTVFYAGGIAGNVTNTGIIQNCYTKGKIEMIANSNLRAGGILGNYDGPAPKNCLALNTSIAMTTTGDIANLNNSRIAIKGMWQKYESTHNNYATSKMALSKNGITYTPVSDAEEAGTDQAFQRILEDDGVDWNGELPSDQWEQTADGYVNLKSIRETFGLQQQIKLEDYVPFAITIPATMHGMITAAPDKKAFQGDTIKLMIVPDLGYRLKSDTVKVIGAVTDTVKFNTTDSSFIMPAQAVSIMAEFVLDSLCLADITDGDSLLILQKNGSWFYHKKNTVTTKSLPIDTNIPFNGTISGTLANDKTLTFEPSCKGELTFDDVTVTTLVIKAGAGAVLNEESKLTYTNVLNEGGALVARGGAEITNSVTGQVKMNILTITTPQNGTLAVHVGNVTVSSGDMLALDTKFSVTATPHSGYQKESLSVKAGSADVPAATDGLYTMPDAQVIVSATFKSTYVPPLPDPTPDPVYYTVTLPTVTGAATDPQAGDYEIKEGTNFSFTLTLEKCCDQSVPVVTANGTVLTPRASDGKYVIYAISADTDIQISGIVPNAPTSNVEIDGEAIHVVGTLGALLISVPQPSSLEIYKTSGTRVRLLDIPEGDSRISLPAGLYIIRVGDHRQKVFIR